MNSTGPADPSGPNPALMSALTTEHYTLQSARTATIVEANGRSMLFLSSVSGATVALALVAQLDQRGGTFLTFALAVLPALLALGLTSYSRLADLAVHDAYYARAIGRIRAFYLTIEPAAQQYWLQPAGDDAHAVMRQAGQPHSRWHHLGHTATSVAAVVGVITGALLGVVGSVATPLSVPVLAAGAAVVAVAAFAVLLADQERRWRRSDGSLQSHFLPDGTPSMTVTASCDGADSGRGRTSFPALVDAATERLVEVTTVAEARSARLNQLSQTSWRGPRPVPPADRRRTAAGGTLGRRTHAKGAPQMPTTALMIGGMSCRHCVREVTSRLRDLASVDTVTADAGTSVVRLSGTMTVDDVLGALRELSYPVQLLDETGEAAET